jgi:hypothetical protein
MKIELLVSLDPKVLSNTVLLDTVEISKNANKQIILKFKPSKITEKMDDEMDKKSEWEVKGKIMSLSGKSLDFSGDWMAYNDSLTIKKISKEDYQELLKLSAKSIKATIQALENKIKTASKYQVISPDGFRIDFSKSNYPSLKAAKEAFKNWKKGYERQGYYSSSRHGRIDLDDLEDYCEFNKKGDSNWKDFA